MTTHHINFQQRKNGDYASQGFSIPNGKIPRFQMTEEKAKKTEI